MKRIVLILAVLTLGAGACSKGSKEPSETTRPVLIPGSVSAHGQATLEGSKPSTTLEVEDDYFEPTFLKTAVGATVSVELDNKGKHSHTFTIDALKVDQMLAPGEKKSLSFTLPASLGAVFYCKFHRPGGMQGAFYYTAGTAFPASAQPGPSTPAGGETGDPY